MITYEVKIKMDSKKFKLINKLNKFEYDHDKLGVVSYLRLQGPKWQEQASKNFDKFTNHFEKHTKAYTIATVGLFGAALIYHFGTQNRDVPETYENFARLDNGTHIVQSFSIPTKGDIINIKQLDEEFYLVSEDATGVVTLKGSFGYEIKPEGRFAPDTDLKTDMAGNYEDSNYWRAVRKGKVKLAPIESGSKEKQEKGKKSNLQGMVAQDYQ